MLKLVGILLLIVLVLGGGGLYLYRQRAVKNLNKDQQPSSQNQANKLNEERLDSIEDALLELDGRLSQLQPGQPLASPQTSTSQVKLLQKQIAELQKEVTALKASTSIVPTPAPSVTSTTSSAFKYPVYISLGTPGSSNSTSWTTLNETQITLDPAKFPGYSNIQLEVTLRTVTGNSAAQARLYNVTDQTAVTNGSVSLTSSTFALATSYGSQLASGSKTYALQVMNTSGDTLFIGDARLKVNF